MPAPIIGKLSHLVSLMGSASQVASLLDRSPRTLRRWVQEGRIPSGAAKAFDAGWKKGTLRELKDAGIPAKLARRFSGQSLRSQLRHLDQFGKLAEAILRKVQSDKQIRGEKSKDTVTLDDIRKNLSTSTKSIAEMEDVYLEDEDDEDEIEADEDRDEDEDE